MERILHRLSRRDLQQSPSRATEHGNVKMDDLRTKAEENKEELAALMITYPSTHGIFETEIKRSATLSMLAERKYIWMEPI